MKFGPLFLMGRKINGIVIFVYSSKYCWDAVISNQDIGIVSTILQKPIWHEANMWH